MLGRIGFVILALFLLLTGFAPKIIEMVKEWRADLISEEFASVSTNATETQAILTLGDELFQGKVVNVDSVESSIAESPIAVSYDRDSQYLTVTGLDSGTSRTLTVNYWHDVSTGATHAAGPFMVLVAIGVCIFIAYRAVRR